jgi:hypothetical protein
MNAGIVIAVLLVLVPLLSLLVGQSDYDDRDRRGWWPGVKAR